MIILSSPNKLVEIAYCLTIKVKTTPSKLSHHIESGYDSKASLLSTSVKGGSGCCDIKYLILVIFS